MMYRIIAALACAIILANCNRSYEDCTLVICDDSVFKIVQNRMIEYRSKLYEYLLALEEPRLDTAGFEFIRYVNDMACNDLTYAITITNRYDKIEFRLTELTHPHLRDSLSEIRIRKGKL